MSNWKKYNGTGVCDVCLRPVKNLKNVYEVPTSIFWSSKKYRERSVNLSMAMGASRKEADDYYDRIRSMDVSAGSAVCEDCIYMFENDKVAPALPEEQSAVIDRASKVIAHAIVSTLPEEPAKTHEKINTPAKEDSKPVNEPSKPVNEKPNIPVSENIAKEQDIPEPQKNELPQSDDKPASDVKPVKKTLSRFPKGWIIFMIVAASCSIATFLPAFAGHADEGNALLMFLYLASILTGYILMLRKKALGFWIALVGNVLLFYMGQVQIGNYLISPTIGVPMTIISFFITMKQIDYRFWKHISLKPKAHTETREKTSVKVNTEELAKAPASENPPEPDTEKAAVFNADIEKEHITVPLKKQIVPKEQKIPKDTSSAPKKDVNWYVIGGIAAFTVIVCVMLILGRLTPNEWQTYESVSDLEYIVPEYNDPGAAADAIQTSGITPEDETRLRAEIEQKLPDALLETAKQFMQDPLFLSAVEQAKLGDCVFDGNTLNITVLMPDPRSENLDRLGIADYNAHSGAQAYIRDNYAKLCAMKGITDYVAYEEKIFLKKDLDGSLMLDNNLIGLTGIPFEYEQVFTPYVSEYMKNKGFHTAALELLMPDFQSWDRHTGTERDMEQLDEYFQSLAEALSFEGITIDEKTVVDVSSIKQALKTRLTSTWAFDSPDISCNGHQTALTVHTLWPTSVAQDVENELRAQYESGAMPIPASVEALETVYLDNIRKKTNALYDDNGLLKTEAAHSMQYSFSWEALGEKGIAACPSLVYDIRQHLFYYDFDLNFLAGWVRIKT